MESVLFLSLRGNNTQSQTSETSESTARLSLAEQWMITEFADNRISCGHTTDFYQGKTDLPRANSSKIFRGKFISGFVLPK